MKCIFFCFWYFIHYFLLASAHLETFFYGNKVLESPSRTWCINIDLHFHMYINLHINVKSVISRLNARICDIKVSILKTYTIFFPWTRLYGIAPFIIPNRFSWVASWSRVWPIVALHRFNFLLFPNAARRVSPGVSCPGNLIDLLRFPQNSNGTRWYPVRNTPQMDIDV